jgi:hypothetical protein
MFTHEHAHIDEANLAHDRATAEAIRRRPELIDIARENLARWIAREGSSIHPALQEWSDILHFLGPSQLADFIASDTPKANRLRQSSPFIGILRRAAELDFHAPASA